MKWMPELRISPSLREMIAILIGLAIFIPLISAVIEGSKVPTVFDIIVGMLPFVCAGAFAMYWALVGIGHERPAIARAVVVRWSIAACVFALLVSWIGIWNDGNLLATLPPTHALLAIASLGIWPWEEGLPVFVRFLPAIVSVGLAWHWREARLPIQKRVIGVCAVYMCLSLAWYALSWVAGVLALLRGSTLETSADAFRILVSAQADGYWIRLQQDRFFATSGRQAETGLMAVQAAILVLLSVVAFLIEWAKRSQAVAPLLRRLLSAHAGQLLLLSAIGYAVALSAQAPRSSYTDFVALLLFGVVVLTWNAWWCFQTEIDHLPEDEKDYPERPLPAGVIAVHELEDLNRVLLLTAFVGAFVLGWPFFIGMLGLTLCAHALSLHGFGWTQVLLPRAGLMICLAMVFGWMGALFGVRDLLLPIWMVRIIVAAAFTVGMLSVIPLLRIAIESRITQMVLCSIALALAVLLSRQPVLWASFLLAFVGLLLVMRRPGKWHRYVTYPVYGFLGSIAFFALFVPQVFQHA